MRQLRRGAPFGWLLALLLPMLVSGGLGGGGAAVLLRHATVAQASGEHQRLSRPVSDGGHRNALVTGLSAAGIGLGGGGGHPLATPPADLRRLSPATGRTSRPARDDDTRSLAALLVRPGRAPPASTAG
ncbi:MULTISPECIES: hypothetical protein [unclassified Streptosporangium]|uniref:hypothetical protein n=1 Tax=unclassified Streptosporangium TaxID=2632669 RepID=UPI002E2CD500|nr:MULTISPECIES: hypothetical protein [unclassified Streptosporangium]